MLDPTPHLSEQDAHAITRQIVARLRARGGRPQQFGVYLMPDGFSFTALLNGRMVTVRTGQGNFQYDDVARELLALSLDPNPWCDRIYEIVTPAGVTVTP